MPWKRIKSNLVLAAFFAGFLISNNVAGADEVRETWDQVRANWNLYEQDGFSATILFYGKRTQTFMENHDVCQAEKDWGPDWRFRVVDLSYKNPGKFFMVYRLSLKEQGLAGEILKKPGVRMVCGVHDTTQLYVKLPITGNAYADKFAEGNVYTSDADSNFCDMRKVSYTRYMKPKFLADQDKYFDNGSVTLEKRKLFDIGDYTVIDMQSGKPVTKPGAQPTTDVLAFIMVPDDPAANKGVTKVEVYVTPVTNQPFGFAEFEGDEGMVSLMIIQNLKLDAVVTDEMFEYFFQDAKVSERKDEDRVACPCLYY